MEQSTPSRQDLRTWVATMEEAGELLRVSGADRENEIGGIVDIYQRRIGGPALLFDQVPGYDPDYKVLANLFMSVKRIALTFGLPENTREVDLVGFWRDAFRNPPTIPPVEVETGPVLDNVETGDDIDMLKIPTPRWHEGDGGYYMGTAVMVIMKDPDSGWINYGAYRVQVHDRKLATVMASKGKHGDQLMRKYFERGEPCPIAVVVGVHPAIFSVAGLEVPYGKNEYDLAGGLIGEGVRVIRAPKTGLPIPAEAEIAFEGFVHPDDRIDEGPLGEWTGYYSGGVEQHPAIRVETFMHRDTPVLTGCIPAVPPNDDTFYRGTYRAGAVWHEMEAAGVPEVRGVWAHPAGGSRMWLTVSIKQQYAGHAKQAGLVASQCHAGAYANRVVIVVDEDIDPADIDQVIWAICTRSDPGEDLDVLRNCWSTKLDPRAYPAGAGMVNSRMILQAVKPWSRMGDWPAIVRSSKELDDSVRRKFAKYLPADF